MPDAPAATPETELDRRQMLALAAAMAVGGVTPAFAQAKGLELAAAQPFSFETLIARAKATAGRPYQPPPTPAPEILEQIDYDAHGKIRFRTELAPFSFEQVGPNNQVVIGKGRFAATFFHLGRYFKKPQRIHVVEGGQAREILYREDYFDMPKDSVAHKLPRGAGFAGFRFQEANAPGGQAPA